MSISYKSIKFALFLFLISGLLVSCSKKGTCPAYQNLSNDSNKDGAMIIPKKKPYSLFPGSTKKKKKKSS
jgi:hypothetical protein